MKCFFVFIVSFFYFNPSFGQTKEREEITIFQVNLNKEYKDSVESPLSKDDRLKFKKHQFYPIDLSYRVLADFILTPNEKTFDMPTTSGKFKEYVKYGEVHFMIHKRKFKLNVYRSIALLKLEEYKNYLFLPFKDFTNSIETYGGGRYMDLIIPETSKIIIDFNKAYNPYCAYSDKFSCPIIPIENSLKIDIKAGIKGSIEH